MEKTHFAFIAISPNFYGKGDTVAEAKAELKKQGGKLSEAVIYVLPEHSENAHVTDFGTVAWTWAEGYDGPRTVELTRVR